MKHMFPDYEWPFTIVQRSDHPYYIAVLPIHLLHRSMKHLRYIVYHVYHTWMQTPPALSHFYNGNEKPHPLRVKRKRMKPSASQLWILLDLWEGQGVHFPDVIRSDPLEPHFLALKRHTAFMQGHSLKRLYCAIHLVYWKWLQKVNPIESRDNIILILIVISRQITQARHIISVFWAVLFHQFHRCEPEFEGKTIHLDRNSAIFGQKNECCFFFKLHPGSSSKQRTCSPVLHTPLPESIWQIGAGELPRNSSIRRLESPTENSF